MPKPSKPIKAFKHKHEKRAHVPSSEEAGYEDANPKVEDAPAVKSFPRNPIVHRGQDPELFWMHKYGADDNAERTNVDIRSLYRHEHIAPEQLIRGLYKIVESEPNQADLFRVNELFGNALEHGELEKVGDYYTHSDGWTNRLIQGDSLLVMTSMLEREGMAGKVQCIYIDPPYGIKYGSNWQIRLNNRTVKDDDDSISGEPEQIKAFRDTWELGIHSYLSYLRDRKTTTLQVCLNADLDAFRLFVGRDWGVGQIVLQRVPRRGLARHFFTFPIDSLAVLPDGPSAIEYLEEIWNVDIVAAPAGKIPCLQDSMDGCANVKSWRGWLFNSRQVAKKELQPASLPR